MVRAAAGSGGPETRRERRRTRIARIPGKKFCALATAGCLCVRRSHSAHQRRQIQKDRVARTIRGLEVAKLSVVRNDSWSPKTHEKEGFSLDETRALMGENPCFFSGRICRIETPIYGGSGAIRRVDAHVFRGEVAGVIAGRGAAGV